MPVASGQSTTDLSEVQPNVAIAAAKFAKPAPAMNRGNTAHRLVDQFKKDKVSYFGNYAGQLFCFERCSVLFS